MGDAARVEQPAARLDGGIRSLIAPLTGLGPLLALMLACAYFTTQTDRFLTGPNLSLVVQQSMVVGVLAIGQTLVILTAGIDLSCGAVMALGSIVMTRLAVVNGVPVLPRHPARHRRLRRVRRAQRRPDHAGAVAAVHRDPGHVEHRVRHQRTSIRRIRQ